MTDKSFVKISVIYMEGEVAISSEKIIAAGDRIILKGRDFGVIPHQSVVEIIGYLQDGIVLMEGKVTLSTESQLNVDLTRIHNKQERRSYLKVKTGKSAVLLKAFSLGRRNKAYAIDGRILIRDLSLGGVSFYANSILLKYQRVEIGFDIITPGFTAMAEVLRRQRGHFGKYRFLYACRFLNISGEMDRALCEFVFKTQLENRKKLLRNGG